MTPWAVTATKTICPRSSAAFDGARSPERRNGATDRALWTSLPPTAGPCRGWARSLLEDETVLPIGTGEMNLKKKHNHQFDFDLQRFSRRWSLASHLLTPA
jgi:hypothetical protein